MTAAPQGFSVISTASLFEELVARLPAPVGAKYRDLEDERDRLHGALVAAQTTWQETHRALTSAQATAAVTADADKRDIDRFNRARQSGTPEPPSPRAAAAQAALAHARDREASRRRGRDESQAAFEASDRLLTAVRELLRTTADPALLVPVLVERHGPKTPRDAAADLERMRASISDVTAELRAVEQAPVPPDVCAARIDARFAELVAQWEPPATDFMARDYRPPGHDQLVPYRVMAYFAQLPEIRAAFHAAAARAYARPGTPAPVPVVEHAARLAALADKRRRAEVLEEQLVLEAAEAGMAIARRPDADPRVVLTTVLAE
jgi:hypothetical protein